MIYSNNSKHVIEEVLNKLYIKLQNKDLRNNTVELLNTHLTFDANEWYLDYGTVRPTNREYVKQELLWYLTKDYCIRGHKGIEDNKIWQSCATENGYVNSNYGALVFGRTVENHNKGQIEYCLELLKKDKCTRQAVMIYTRPSLHWENNDGIHANHDFTCTINTQVFITNDDELEYIVNMRSNDAIFGLQNDYCWHKHVYETLFRELISTYPNLKRSKIHWNAGSMHLYERHFELLKNICDEYKENNVG